MSSSSTTPTKSSSSTNNNKTATEFVIKNDLPGMIKYLETIDTNNRRRWAQQKDGAGVRALHVAAELGRLEFIEYFVDSGLDTLVNKADEDARTPLHWSAWKGQVEVTRALIEMGASYDRPTRTGFTPLHYATTSGKLECVKVIVEAGAIINSLDESQQKPVDVAERFGYSAIRDYLQNEAPIIAENIRQRKQKQQQQNNIGSSSSTTTTLLTPQQQQQQQESFLMDLEREAMELEEAVEAGNLERLVLRAVETNQTQQPQEIYQRRPQQSNSWMSGWKNNKQGGKINSNGFVVRDYFPLFLVCAVLMGVGCGIWIGNNKSQR
jgi:ankyrin repeat protein